MEAKEKNLASLFEEDQELRQLLRAYRGWDAITKNAAKLVVKRHKLKPAKQIEAMIGEFREASKDLAVCLNKLGIVAFPKPEELDELFSKVNEPISQSVAFVLYEEEDQNPEWPMWGANIEKVWKGYSISEEIGWGLLIIGNSK